MATIRFRFFAVLCVLGASVANQIIPSAET
jgi:hypothetical protein